MHPSAIELVKGVRTFVTRMQGRLDALRESLQVQGRQHKGMHRHFPSQPAVSAAPPAAPRFLPASASASALPLAFPAAAYGAAATPRSAALSPTSAASSTPTPGPHSPAASVPQLLTMATEVQTFVQQSALRLHELMQRQGWVEAGAGGAEEEVRGWDEVEKLVMGKLYASAFALDPALRCVRIGALAAAAAPAPDAFPQPA